MTKYRLRDATFNETFINNYKVKASWIFPFDLNISKQDTKGSILYLFINQNVPHISEPKFNTVFKEESIKFTIF